MSSKSDLKRCKVLLTMPRRSRPRRKLATRTYVKRIVSRNLETKSHNEYGGVLCSDTPALVCLSDIAQGDTSYAREGSIVNAVGYRCNFYFKANLASTAPVLSRVVFFQWKQNNQDSAPTVGDIMFDTTNQDILSFYRTDVKGTFKILYDTGPVSNVAIEEQYTNATPANVTQMRGAHAYRVYKISIPRSKLLSKLQFEQGTTGGTNMIYALYWSTTATADDQPSFAYQSRLLFKDG